MFLFFTEPIKAFDIYIDMYIYMSINKPDTHQLQVYNVCLELNLQRTINAFKLVIQSKHHHRELGR